MATLTPLHRGSQEFDFELQREDSFDALPDTGPAQKVNEDPQELRESSKKVSKAVAKTTCGLTKIGVTVGLGACGEGNTATIVVGALTAAEEVAIKGSEEIVDSGYCDNALKGSQELANRCVVL